MVGRNEFQNNEMDDDDFISDLLEREENADDENVDDKYNDRGLNDDEDGLQKRTQI